MKLSEAEAKVDKAFPHSKFDPERKTGRVPFGIFDLDLSLGGGIPRGKVTQIYGKESGGKTAHALKMVSTFHQLEKKDQQVVWIDVEQTHEDGWAERFGVDISRLHVYQPATAEETIDMVDHLCRAEDVGLLIVDSLAAMVSTDVVEKDSGYQEVGRSAVKIQTLAKKIVNAQTVRARQDNPFTAVLLNQLRVKIGQLFGNPEQPPGGNNLKHCCSMILSAYGKKTISKAVDPKVASYLDVSMSVQKWKTPILAQNAQYNLPIHPGCPEGIGNVISANKIVLFGKEFGFVHGGGKEGWTCFGVEFAKQDQFKTVLVEDPGFRLDCERQIFERALEAYESSNSSE